MTGNIYCNGGSVSGRGGGGAGGWVHSYFRFGDYHSGFVEAKGNSKKDDDNIYMNYEAAHLKFV